MVDYVERIATYSLKPALSYVALALQRNALNSMIASAVDKICHRISLKWNPKY